ncbi:GerAB/ArcD/ProY family transporter [Bacillus dakarensis]|uniref:GerAB/ArcD/ProY family transporter n=1 Tax=Robertmurraya dakarensis TaxID=1926278 RepID=UPI0009814A68|nr:endospore germination permease [Bacillus dakarensis]
MLEKGKISAFDFQVIVLVFTIGSSILVGPGLLARFAKQDAWMASSLALMISVSFVFLYIRLASLYPSLTFVECNEKILGKWIGNMVSILFLSYFYYLSSGLVREIGDFLTTQVLVETPIQMIMIMFLLISLFGVRLGLEVICRTAVIFFPWIVGFLLMWFLFLIPEIKLVHIQPIFEGGIVPIIQGSYHSLGLPFLELAIFLMISPYVTEKESVKKAFYRGTFIGGIILSFLVTISILVMGAEFTARNTYPSYILGKKISIGEFVQRIEIIVAIIWLFTIYFKLTICYYGLALGLAQVFKLNNYKILLFPLAFLIISLALFSHPDIVHFHEFLDHTWTPLSLTICFFLPLFVYVIGVIRKKRAIENQSNTENI